VTLRDRLTEVLFSELCRVLPEDAPGVDCVRLADLCLKEIDVMPNKSEAKPKRFNPARAYCGDKPSVADVPAAILDLVFWAIQLDRATTDEQRTECEGNIAFHQGVIMGAMSRLQEKP
jgi:hypothetical protein